MEYYVGILYIYLLSTKQKINFLSGLADISAKPCSPKEKQAISTHYIIVRSLLLLT